MALRILIQFSFCLNRRNFLLLVRVLMGVGVDCLRNYFLTIHPNWTNQPTDASSLKKGVLKLQKHEDKKYYTGDINKWDISLLIHVLRFTAVSAAHLKLHPDIDTALRNIQDVRNNVVCHASEKKINEPDFQKLYKHLKESLVAIGGSEDTIDDALTGTYVIKFSEITYTKRLALILPIILQYFLLGGEKNL